MPGPGARGKGKVKKSKTQTSEAKTEVTTIRLPEIDDAATWDGIVSTLCNFFKLPDLTTRNGLKKVHANFASIYANMNQLYNHESADYRVKGGIVGIAARMCIDALLRNRLFEKGILDQILPLLDIDETRHLALRSLSTITHHGGAKIRCEIAKHADKLTQLMRDLPDDENVAELGVITLGHSVIAAAEGDAHKPNFPDVLQSLDMPNILKTVLETIKRTQGPMNPRLMIEHALQLLTLCSLHSAKAYKACPSSINFLVAGMRSKDWVTRSACIGGLIRLYRLEAEDDVRQFDPNRFIAAAKRGIPDHLDDILLDYGPFRSETFQTLACANDFQAAMMACTQNRDLYALGLKQASLILTTEFSISEGCFEVEDPRTGGRRRLTDDIGLPFKMWSESLPLCARAIRARRKPEDEDAADILDIKYFIMKQRIPDAVAHAKKALQRNHEQAYFYYAITLSADNVGGLRAAKKGMKCKLITPFVRYQMMHRAVEHAGDMGIKLLENLPEAGDQNWEEGIAFLMSALEDAKTYVDEAPPDNRHMKNVGYWYVLLTILTREVLSLDLRELKDNIDKLRIADEFSEFMGIRPPNTNLRLAQRAAVKHYSGAVREFSGVFERLDNVNVKDGFRVDREKLDDSLAAWFEDMRLEDGTLEERMKCQASEEVRKVNFENVELYRCSYCGNPSAALRKCSGCAKTRYCDAGCQKRHWSSHKTECKKV